jgi:uncharacterized protein (TIGR02246 family)
MPHSLPQHPQEITARFSAAWNARDANLLASLFAEDADFVNVAGLWWSRKEDIRKAHQYGLTTFFKDSVLTVTKVKVRYLHDAVATVHGRWKITGQLAPDGSIAGDRRGIFIFVVTQTEGGWLCTAAQNTDILPGAETILISSAGTARGMDYRKK